MTNTITQPYYDFGSDKPITIISYDTGKELYTYKQPEHKKPVLIPGKLYYLSGNKTKAYLYLGNEPEVRYSNTDYSYKISRHDFLIGKKKVSFSNIEILFNKPTLVE